MLDKSSISSQVYYGFRQNAAFYNSLPIAKSVLVQNEICEENIVLVEATNEQYFTRFKVQKDLTMISLISWGFHYPIATYLEKVYSLLITGIAFVDVRKGTDGIEKLEERFGRCTKVK